MFTILKLRVKSDELRVLKLKNSIIRRKSFGFSLKIIKVYQNSSKTRGAYVLLKQLLRCGTSIGANVEESQAGCSKSDFIFKITIAHKEAREAKYWIQLLMESGLLDRKRGAELLQDCEELIRILSSIIITSRKNS